MSQYLVAIHLPDNFNPSAADDAAMGRDIDTLNEEIVAAGGRIFVDGLTTDGSYQETQEHLGGSWVLEVAGLDEALAWGRKAVIACRASVEVRPLGVPA